MKEDGVKKPMSDDELGEVTGGAGVRKDTGTRRKFKKMGTTLGSSKKAKSVATASASVSMMPITCSDCGNSYDADVSKASSTCPKCGHTTTFSG